MGIDLLAEVSKFLLLGSLASVIFLPFVWTRVLKMWTRFCKKTKRDISVYVTTQQQKRLKRVLSLLLVNVQSTKRGY